eukprot:gene18124-biopygen11439
MHAHTQHAHAHTNTATSRAKATSQQTPLHATTDARSHRASGAVELSGPCRSSTRCAARAAGPTRAPALWGSAATRPPARPPLPPGVPPSYSTKSGKTSGMSIKKTLGPER